MKTEDAKLKDKQTEIENGIIKIEKYLLRLKANLIHVKQRRGLIPSEGYKPSASQHINDAMLELLVINKGYSGKGLREINRSWRRFLASPVHVQTSELERCNISVEKIGTNGRRFTRREF